MRIESEKNKSNKVLAGALSLVALIGATLSSAHAQTPGAVALPSAAPTISVPSAPTAPIAGGPQLPAAPGVSVPATIAPQIASTTPAAPAVPADIRMPSSPASSSSESGNVKALENKATDAVKQVIENLSLSTEKVTLDDLNSAKIAMAKLDVMIEMEKKLADLDKVRSDREKGSNSNFSSISASALMPPPMQPTITDTPRRAVDSSGSYTLRRVNGAAGQMVAVIGSGDGDKNVKIGDRLSDDSLVTNISSTAVELNKKGTTRRLTIQNANVIFGRSY